MATVTADLPVAAPSGGRTRPAAEWCFLAAWVVIAAGFAGLVYLLLPVWASKPELMDRGLILVGAAGVVYFLWPRLRAAEPRPAFWGLIPLAAGAAAFALGWYVGAVGTTRTLVVWWLVAAFGLTVLGLTVAHFGRRHAMMLVFPLAFCFFSLPAPGRLYNPLQLRLKQFTTTAAQTALPWLGVEVSRPDPQAFELILASGSLGVVEACSGVRSVMPLTAIAVLVAYARGFGMLRGLILVVLTVPVIAVVNALRVTVTGVLQESVGRHAIEGWWHETLGIAVVLVGMALIIGLSSLIAPPTKEEVPPPGPARRPDLSGPAGAVRGLVALAALAAAAGACLWSEQYRVDHRVLVRLDELPEAVGPWRGRDLEVPEAVKDELQCDQILRRDYFNEFGQSIQVWVMFWGNAATTAHMHHPDICYPWRGWTVTQSTLRPLDVTGGGELPVSVRHYAKPEQQQILFFWTQNGSHVVAEGVEAPERFSGHSWVAKALRGQRPGDQGARISVLIGTQTRGSVESGEKLLREFTREFVGGLYAACPWARPRAPQD